MKSYEYKDLKVEVTDEPTYKFGSSDNNFNYSKHYFGVGGREYPTSNLGVKICKDENVLDSCILIASGGATNVHENSAVLDNDRLLVCCCQTVFCLTLPGLDLKWKTEADPMTCFQIFKYQNDYIIHGELQVTKLGRNGEIMWKFGGSDIFLSIDNEKVFKIEDDGICLTDFANNKYKIDFEGRLFSDRYKASK